eukprot:ANDGO_07612.mRNA.1 hypothetical protein
MSDPAAVQPDVDPEIQQYIEAVKLKIELQQLEEQQQQQQRQHQHQHQHQQVGEQHIYSTQDLVTASGSSSSANPNSASQQFELGKHDFELAGYRNSRIQQHNSLFQNQSQSLHPSSTSVSSTPTSSLFLAASPLIPEPKGPALNDFDLKDAPLHTPPSTFSKMNPFYPYSSGAATARMPMSARPYEKERQSQQEYRWTPGPAHRTTNAPSSTQIGASQHHFNNLNASRVGNTGNFPSATGSAYGGARMNGYATAPTGSASLHTHSQNLALRPVSETLSSENALLRAELSSMSSLNRELRREMERLKTEQQSFSNETLRARDAQKQSEIEALRRELALSQSELARAVQIKHSAEDIARRSSDDKESQQHFAVALETQAVRAGSRMQQLADGLEKYTRDLLPNYVPPQLAAMEDATAVASGDSEDSFGIGFAVGRIERTTQLLRLVVEAKIETFNMMRQKLKEENFALKAEVERLANRSAVAQSSNADAGKKLEAERAAMRDEVEELERLYTQRMDTLRRQLEDAKRTAEDAQARADAYVREASLARDESSTRERSLDSLRADLEREQSARAVLAAELSSARETAQKLKDEIEQLRLTQKFLGTANNGTLTHERLDVMRTMEKLLQENRSLKVDKARLEADAVQVRRENVQQKVASNLGDRELMMAAMDVTSSYEITSKLLQRNIANTQGAPPSMAQQHSVMPSSARPSSAHGNYGTSSSLRSSNLR